MAAKKGSKSAGVNPWGLTISNRVGIGVGYDKYSRRELGQIWDHERNTIGTQLFWIKYKKGNDDKYFNFAMLPAIESTISRGSPGVPEVKPGLVGLTSVKHKTILVPGCKPIIQSIGVQSTIYQITGLFIGTEQFDLSTKPTKPASSKTIYRMPSSSANIQHNTREANAINIAKRFDKDIVQKTKPVFIHIYSDGLYEYEGLIINFKHYGVRGDKAYYAMDILSTGY